MSKLLQVFALALLATSPAVAQRAPTPAVETLASFPNGTFLENLTLADDGAAIITSYFDMRLLRLKDGKLQAPLAQLDVHPVGIIAVADGYWLTAHGKPFSDAPAFLSTNKIVKLAKDGTVERVIDAPDARFLNGLVAIAPNRLLIADSIAGTIWHLDTASGALKPWLQDEALMLDPAVQPFRPAANGLKLHGGALFVSNSSRGAIYRVALDASGNARGKPVPYVQPGPIDDFAIRADGTIFAATHGEKLLEIAPGGAARPVLESGCDACTSVALVHDGAALIVLTTGSMLEGGKLPARIFRVSLPKH